MVDWHLCHIYKLPGEITSKPKQTQSIEAESDRTLTHTPPISFAVCSTKETTE